VAVIVPDPAVLAIIAGEVGYKFDPTAPPAVAAAVKNEQVKEAVLKAVTDKVKKTGLKGLVIISSLRPSPLLTHLISLASRSQKIFILARTPSQLRTTP